MPRYSDSPDGNYAIKVTVSITMIDRVEVLQKQFEDTHPLH